GVMEVRATAGDNFLGGEDFLQAMTMDFLRRSGLAMRLGPTPLETRQARKLRDEMERGKRALSEQPSTTL
ncbi:Hsp70 family protein, partial [Escherichia coli]|uniref:Hsp70 family protein n=3 Tax=Bacteria TaxID=2 RepID=UPI0039E1CA40